MRRSVGIVGGGILGLTAAYRLAQAGIHVELFERSADLGGLVGTFELDGFDVDRFYHVVLPGDDRVRGLAAELGLGERFRFRPTKVGFYDSGRLFSMTTPLELLRFPLLPLPDRLRLGAFVARCRLLSDQAALDGEPLVPWLERLCGERAVERLWKPLLDSKFDGGYDDLPATYIWARTRRMGATRDSGGREVLGSIEGGYRALVDALAARIRELGGGVHAATAVERIERAGLVVGGRVRAFDHVLCTLAPPQARALLSPELVAAAPADHCRYIGVVCLVVRARRSVSPYYHLNITDRRIPLTTVVETTHVVDPDAVGGHLLYVTRYVDPAHADHDRPAAEIERDYLAHARTMLPALREEDVLATSVQRARITEPVHLVGGAARIPAMHAATGLTLASTAHVYPEIVSGQATIGVAERAVAQVLEHGFQNERRAAA